MFKKYPNYQIVNLDKLTYAGNPANLKDIENNPNYSFMQGDICDPQVVDEVMKKVDCVVHFAAESHGSISINFPALHIDTANFVCSNLILYFPVYCKWFRKRRYRFI